MSQSQQEYDELGSRIAELEDKLAAVSGDLAELNEIMAPFMARYRRLIQPYYDELVAVEREIADFKVALGDRTASAPADARSPLDQFFEGPSVQDQFERTWQGKKPAHPSGRLNRDTASPDVRKFYRQVVVHVHPILADSPQERDRRRQLFMKVDEAFVQRNQPTLQMMAESYVERSYLPAVRDGTDPLQELRDRAVKLEAAIGKLEGHYYDLRYGLLAKLKSYAEQAWAEQKRDLVAELSHEIQGQLLEAQAELETLKTRS